jgi:hypothetical protein
MQDCRENSHFCNFYSRLRNLVLINETGILIRIITKIKWQNPIREERPGMSVSGGFAEAKARVLSHRFYRKMYEYPG